MKTKQITDQAERTKILNGIRETSYTNPCNTRHAHRVAWTIITDSLGFKPLRLGEGLEILERRSDLPLIVRNNYGIV